MLSPGWWAGCLGQAYHLGGLLAGVSELEKSEVKLVLDWKNGYAYAAVGKAEGILW